MKERVRKGGGIYLEPRRVGRRERMGWFWMRERRSLSKHLLIKGMRLRERGCLCKLVRADTRMAKTVSKLEFESNA